MMISLAVLTQYYEVLVFTSECATARARYAITAIAGWINGARKSRTRLISTLSARLAARPYDQLPWNDSRWDNTFRRIKLYFPVRNSKVVIRAIL